MTRCGWLTASLPILLVLIAGALFWDRGRLTPATEARTVLVVGDQKGGAQALLEASGELAHMPYRIKWALFPAASPLLEALDAGAIDVGGVGAAPYAFAYAGGAKIKAIIAYRPPQAEAGRASAIVVPKESPIHTLADLRGKRLATIKGSAGQDLALKLLEKAGLKPGDVQWTYLANGEAKAALASGSIDAWSTWGSYVGIAVLENGDRILADGSGVPTGAVFFAAGDGAIRDKLALLADFAARLARARLWGQTHQEDYARTLARDTGIPIDVARFAAGAALGETVPIDAALIAEQRDIFRRYQAAGLIPAVPDLKGGYIPDFNSAAQPATAR
ncbi:ABC transporter substrate-binding protein [Sphingobium sp. 3R8]|uniref:ABC transporter substrate-binding protein n=1 Tax=Sphingobium sp. 3R8 TaxID=2874921 RepID=UPI001CCEF5E3|nr:ABC transporter substrate-binding protein [Sphingobium sp. 3R8]MBZ9648465.1 ABC transporter substrate-binding protein [Sphingobium sp. 3R8]